MRAKYRVEKVYNNGKNVVLAPIVGTPADTMVNPKTGATVVLTPEVPTPAENLAFFDADASPGGDIRLPMLSAANAGEFTEGREIFVDFTPAS